MKDGKVNNVSVAPVEVERLVMPVRVRLQNNNGKFEGEFEIISGSGYDDEVEAATGYDSVLVHLCITTMHHDTRGQAKSAAKKIMKLLAQRLVEAAAQRDYSAAATDADQCRNA